jgi:hypothetical protein
VLATTPEIREQVGASDDEPRSPMAS